MLNAEMLMKLSNEQRYWYSIAMSDYIKISNLLKQVFNNVISIADLYCNLVKLDKADAIDLDMIIDRRIRDLIEKLISIYNIKCEVEF